MTEYRIEHTNLGWGWREKVEKGKRKGTGVLQCRDKIEVDPDSARGIEDYISLIRAAAAVLEEADIGMDVDYGSYGDRDRDRVYVEGWRDATPAEIATVQQQRVDALKRQRAIEEETAARLKATRPDLFS